jgi:hypothetical protein
MVQNKYQIRGSAHIYGAAKFTISHRIANLTSIGYAGSKAQQTMKGRHTFER